MLNIFHYCFLLCTLHLFSIHALQAQNQIYYAPIRFIETPAHWDSIFALAQSENKAVFIDAYANWCMPYKSMNKKVFNKNWLGEYYNQHFINIRIETETPLGKEISKKFAIHAYPTFLFFNKEGQLIHRASGFLNDTLFLDLGKQALNPLLQSENLAIRFEQGDRDPDFLFKYAYILHKNNDLAYMDIVNAYLATQNVWSGEKTLQIIFDLIDDVQHGAFGYYLNHQKLFRKYYTEDEIETKTMQAVIHELNEMIFEKEDEFDIEQDVPFVFYKYFAKDKATPHIDYYKLLFFANQGDWKEFFNTAFYYELKYLSHPNLLKKRQEDYKFRGQKYRDLAAMVSKNSLDKKHLQTARRWTKRSVSLDPSYQNYYALASFYYNLNDKKKAKKYLKKSFHRAQKVSMVDREFLAELEVFKRQVWTMRSK